MWGSGFMGRLRFGALKATLLHKFISLIKIVHIANGSNLMFIADARKNLHKFPIK